MVDAKPGLSRDCLYHAGLVKHITIMGHDNEPGAPYVVEAAQPATTMFET